MFSVDTFLHAFGPLVLAARFTLLISLLGIGLGLVLGALICAARLSPLLALRRFAAVWVSFLRGVPLLVQLLLVYYLLPVIGIDVPAMVAAVVTVGICASAYISEIWRGAIAALPRGQAEAAAAIGMGPLDIWTRVILPQAIPPMTPAVGNYLIAMFKDTPMLSAITVVELLQTAKIFGSERFRYLEPFTLVGILFLALSLVAAAGVRWSERRFRVEAAS